MVQDFPVQNITLYFSLKGVARIFRHPVYKYINAQYINIF